MIKTSTSTSTSSTSSTTKVMVIIINIIGGKISDQEGGNIEHDIII